MLVKGDVRADELAEAMTVVSNWRASHAFPLNTFQVGLRKRALAFDPDSVVAQRLKRMPTIEDKLKRFPTMKLSQMQDIGGCRAIVSHVRHVRKLRESYLASRIKHRLAREDDYLRSPKADGYRGIHLVYRYHSDRQSTYNGHLIEIQLRSRRQHEWATAVETVGTLLSQSLKSDRGEQGWLRFFALMSGEMAAKEASPGVPGTPADRNELRRELRKLEAGLKVRETLEAFGQAFNVIEEKGQGPRYFLLDLRPEERRVSVTGFTTAELGEATNRYLQAEEAIGASGAAVVLVSVASISALLEAYPNFYLDTKGFLEEVRMAVEG